MESNKIDEYFKLLSENFKDNKFVISWRQDKLVIIDRIDYSDSIDKGEFKDFVSEFTEALRDSALSCEVDSKYLSYVDKFFYENKDVKDDIITRCTSNLDICNLFGIEILTKRVDLKPKCFSALFNFTLQKPNPEKEVSDQFVFELSLRDLKTLSKALEETIKDIEELKSEL